MVEGGDNFGFVKPMVKLAAIAALCLLAFGACSEEKKGLRITGLSPKTGPYTGGSRVTIEGSGFASGGATGVKVYFGDRLGRQVVFEGDNTLYVEPPPGAIGETVDVVMIFDDGRKFTYPKAYTYVDLTEGFSVDELTEGKKKKEGGGE